MKVWKMGSTTARGVAVSALLVAAVAGQAFAAGTIKGKVLVPSTDFDPSAGFVVAVSEKLNLYRVQIDADGAYMIENAAAGKYTISAVRGGLSAPDVTGVELKDGATLEQNFSMIAAKPFHIPKVATPIGLNQGIDSDAFKDAVEVRVDQAKNLGVGPPEEFYKDGGHKLVAGRFRIKYSDQAIHLAADVTFARPLVNNKTDGDLWNGNALEFDIQNDPYDPTRTDKNKEHNWQLVVGLGQNADWWEHNVYNMRPIAAGKTVSIGAHIAREFRADGEKFRLDVPWAILLQGDENGKGIDPPKEDSLGAIDFVLDVCDPAAATSDAVRKYQIQWSGMGNSHWNASSMVPVRWGGKP